LRTQPGNKLKNAEKALKMLESRPTSFEDCVAYGRHKFDKYFRNKILQLLHNFPLDMTTKEGTPFWSGAKRYIPLGSLCVCVCVCVCVRVRVRKR
jgi:hypothetical protein